MITKSQWESLPETQKQHIVLGMQNKFEPKTDVADNSLSDIEWITQHFYIPEIPYAMWLAPYQKKFLKEALSKDKDGLYKYSLVLYLDKKKHIKSCISAAIALRRAFQLEWGNIMVVSNSLTQSQSRSFYYIVRCLSLNPQMKTMLDNGDIKINRTEIVFNFNKTKISAVPLAPDTQAGNNNDLSIFSEIWAYRHESHKRMITETAVPPNLYGKAQRFMESYVGFSNESVVLERWFNQLVSKDNLLFNKPETYVDGQTIMMWNHGLECRVPWVTDEYLAQQRKELTESEFRRVMLNEWVSSESQFIDPVQWDLCQSQLPPLKPKEKLILALDVGLSNDCFAIIGVNKIRGKIAVRTVKVWIPKKGEKLHFTNPTGDKSKDKDYPYGYLEWLSKQFKIITLRYDPYQAEKLAEDLIRNRICACEPFSQQSEREKSDKYLYDLIREQNIIHDGNTILTAHIKNANAQNKGENKLRLIKRNEAKKIDSAVALSMAAYTCKDYRI